MAMLRVYVVVALVWINFAYCEEYFVSVNDGSDDNSGTFSKPWQHVKKALSVLKPGDICTMRGGRYFEEIEINGLVATPYEPIIFRSYEGENVIFDGTGGSIQAKWTKYKGNIYQTTIEQDIWQLFVDEEMQINARWPNAFWYDYSVFDYTKWGFSASNSSYNMEKGIGVMNDNGTQGLANSGVNATGAIAILNIGSWKTFAGLVTSHTPNEPNFVYRLEKPVGQIKFVPSHCRYFLEDKLEFLDAPTEWFYEMSTKKLFLWTKSSDSPENHVITGKISTYAFTINKSSWIKLIGLSFFASTINIVSDRKTGGIELYSCHFSYPSYSKRMLGSLAVPNATTIFYEGGLTEDAGNFTIFNCTWEFSDGGTINYRGGNGLIQNNLWHHNDFSCVGDGFAFQSKGNRDVFIRNVIHSNGPSVGYSPGAGHLDKSLPAGDFVKLNMLYDLKFLQDDGSHIQTGVNAQNSTIIENNWCFDTMKYGLRFDRVNSDDASWGYNGTMTHNVIWNTGGVMVKGDKHHVLNNLIFDSIGLYDMHLFGGPGSSVESENNHTVIANNIIQSGACNEATVQPCPGNPGNFTNNIQYVDVHTHLRDPDNFDFRPVPQSRYVTKDIGPYGEESMKHGGVYWIPGRQLLTASFPIPPNGTVTAKCNASIMWLDCYSADHHDVYFGTDKSLVMKASNSSNEFRGSFKVPSNIVDPGLMKPGITYYWRVDGVLASKIISKGTVWEFQCK